ncbi:MAG: histidine phosphatase family protein [Candidatus Hodarchaeales archaeon]|jgi:probable phosphoglycerate mutase
MYIYLIRHGESTANREKVFQGWNNVHLSEKGKIQAKKLSSHFLEEKIKFGNIFSSPLARAMETAEPLTICSTNHGIIIVDGFKSINVGDWGGRVISKVREEFSEEYNVWRTRPEDFQFPKGESLTDVQSRSRTSLLRILDELDDFNLNIVIVSHMITIKVLALSMLGKDLSHVWDEEYTVPNTGIMVFDVKRDVSNDNFMFQRVVMENSIPHL